jgi:hypothetical protein
MQLYLTAERLPPALASSTGPSPWRITGKVLADLLPSVLGRYTPSPAESATEFSKLEPFFRQLLVLATSSPATPKNLVWRESRSPYSSCRSSGRRMRLRGASGTSARRAGCSRKSIRCRSSGRGSRRICERVRRKVGTRPRLSVPTSGDKRTLVCFLEFPLPLPAPYTVHILSQPELRSSNRSLAHQLTRD